MAHVPATWRHACSLRSKSIEEKRGRTHKPAVKCLATNPTNLDLDGEYAKLLAGDLRMERKRKAPWKHEEDIMMSGLDLGNAIHHDIPSSFLGPILKSDSKDLHLCSGCGPIKIEDRVTVSCLSRRKN